MNNKEKFDEFVDAQLKLFNEMSDQLTETALAYHKETCIDPQEGCETDFLRIYMLVFAEKMVAAQNAAKSRKYFFKLN